MTKSLFAVVLILTWIQAFPQKPTNALAVLASWHLGEFDNSPQVALDDTYFEVNLNIVQIWPKRRDGYWLYAEQAISDQLNVPYRQRIYQLYTQDSFLVRKEFMIPRALRYAGGHKFRTPLDDLSKDSLILRKGCGVYFQFINGAFIGKTRERECESEIKGVAYATSEVVISDSGFSMWDRGFNEAGMMVWGKAQGPYEFIPRIERHLKPIKEALAKDSILLQTPSPKPPDIDLLVAYLSGHFESKNQTSDMANYYDIRLDVVPIWKKTKDDIWLYAEESMADQKEVSYRQQVFHVFKQGNLFMREVYTLKNPVTYVGPTEFKKTLKRLRRDSLQIVEGCEVYFRYDSGRFRGQSNRLTCPTNIPGADSGMAELEVTGGQMVRLDRGFDKGGDPVAGLVQGPFVFTRKREEKK